MWEETGVPGENPRRHSRVKKLHAELPCGPSSLPADTLDTSDVGFRHTDMQHKVPTERKGLTSSILKEEEFCRLFAATTLRLI